METQWMKRAITLAEQAAQAGEVPVGAVLVDKNEQLIAEAYNLVETIPDPTAHAEMLVIRNAAKTLNSNKLIGTTLYVTLEPCAMCAQSIAYSRIDTIIFGAYDPKSGGVEHGARIFDQPTCHHKPKIVGGMEEKACSLLLTQFFEGKR